jgi:hypothetical protein
MSYTAFSTKKQAQCAVEDLGYVQIDEGCSGDGAYGTRIYYEHHCNSKDVAEISKVGAVWFASINYKPI